MSDRRVDVLGGRNKPRSLIIRIGRLIPRLPTSYKPMPGPEDAGGTRVSARRETREGPKHRHSTVQGFQVRGPGVHSYPICSEATLISGIGESAYRERI